MPETTEVAIKMIKDHFQMQLADVLQLRRVTAPLFVLSGTGLNDDLNGVERAVTFPVKDLGDRRAEVVHSLAKWKRVKLGAYDIAPGYGLYTDMNAIRADEELDNLHSLYVDQWDWEKTIRPEDRTLDYLKDTVRKIYNAVRQTELMIFRQFPHITRRGDIHTLRRAVATLPRPFSRATRIGGRTAIWCHIPHRYRRTAIRWQPARRTRTRLRRLDNA